MPRRGERTWLLPALALFLAAGTASAAGAAPADSPTPVWKGTTERVSVTSDGDQVGGGGQDITVSRDGDVVAFLSYAPDLVRGDTNAAGDVFVRNLNTGRVQRVSIGSNGREGGQDSRQPALSATGRYVAFMSEAGDLVRGDTNHSWDVFVHDRRTGRTERVSIRSNGDEVFGQSSNPSISADGRVVAFVSYSDQLVRGDENDYPDVYVHDRTTGKTSRVSVSSQETEGWSYSYHPSVSANGRFVAFYSLSDNLTARDDNANTDVYVRNLERGTTHLVSLGNHEQLGNGSSSAPTISGDGRFVAFASSAGNLVAGDTNHHKDVFVRDRQKKSTERVSIGNGGVQGNDDSLSASISADGRLIAFESRASNWLDEEATTDGASTYDIFVHNRRLGTTHWASVARHHQVPTRPSRYPTVTSNGPVIAFESDAGNLVPADTNRVPDAFIRYRK